MPRFRNRQEGLELGPIKIVRAGQLQAEVLDILQRNDRAFNLLTGDLFAQEAARTGGIVGVVPSLCF